MFGLIPKYGYVGSSQNYKRVQPLYQNKNMFFKLDTFQFLVLVLDVYRIVQS